MEPTHAAILEAIAAHRGESAARWEAVAQQLKEHREQLGVIPVMQAELAENTRLTKLYAGDLAAREADKQRQEEHGRKARLWGAFAGLAAAGLAVWAGIKSLLSSGPPMGPHP